MGIKPSKSKRTYNVSGDEDPPGSSSRAAAAEIPSSTTKPTEDLRLSSSPIEKTREIDMTDTIRVCSVNDVKLGDVQAVRENGDGTETEAERIKDFEVADGRKILLANENGQYYAVGSKCTHYAAPLAKGSYCKGLIRCQWHGACFNVKNGDIEDFPGLDSLPSFQTIVIGDAVHIVAPPELLSKSKVTRPMSKFSPDSQDGCVLIVGGGAAGLSCAESLRQNNFTGKIVILAKESCLPYDRPKLSKAADIEVEKIYLRPPEFYKQYDLEVLVNQEVVDVDANEKHVLTKSGEKFAYDRLVVCTGGEPRVLNCPGSDLANICYLRTPADSKNIYGLCDGKRIVVIGSSFIGMELACHFVSGAHKAESVTVVGRSARPLELVFGPEIGSRVQQLHESNGVEFRMNATVQQVCGDGAVSEVVLDDNSVLKADLVVVGIGVVPSTAFLKNCGVNLTKSQHVIVDELMRTNVPDIYACGDIVTFPLSSFGGESCNVQHWQMALKHGKTAGSAIAGKPFPIETVPFFWSVMFGKSVRYAGYGAGHDKIVIHGSLEDLKFVAYFMKKGSLVAVASLNKDPVAAQIANCFRIGAQITAEDVEKNSTDDWSFLL